ncbi:MAG: carboxypeptidase regulatory-like domain-containing protein [bacterium]
MKRISLLIMCALVTAGMSWLACDKETIIGDKAYAISGTVTDSVTGLAINGATVKWPDTTGNNPDPKVTDSTGEYIFPLYGDHTTVYVQKTGYRTKWKQLTSVTANVSDCDFQLAPETTASSE